MAGEKTSIPEAWLGQPVKPVFLGGSSPDSTIGDLQEVNDRGVVPAIGGKGAVRRKKFLPGTETPDQGGRSHAP